MAIIMNVNESQFRQAFVDMGRADQFSYAALGELFAYFNEQDEAIELDVISLCCDFYEASIDEIISQYALEDEIREDDIDLENSDPDDIFEWVKEWLENQTLVIGVTEEDHLLYENF